MLLFYCLNVVWLISENGINFIVIEKSQIMYVHLSQFAYYYQTVHVFSLSLSHSDHIKHLPL